MALPGGSFNVVDSSGHFTDEATQAIVNQIAGQITESFGGWLDPERKRLLDILPRRFTPNWFPCRARSPR